MSEKIPYGIQDSFSVFKDTMVEMTWQEIQASADRNAVVLLPVGTVEAHGPHMDLSADFYLSTLFCRFLKQELEKEHIEALIAPPMYWGISRDVAKYAGTFSVSPATMESLLTDIFLSLKSWGFKNVFVTNAHGDPLHIEMIKKAVNEANKVSDFKIYTMWDLDIDVDSDLELPEMSENIYEPDYHAGAVETAQMLTYFPEKVRTDIAKSLLPQDTFHPLAYCGDPAGYGLKFNFAEYAAIDTKLDALKIKAILDCNKQ
jgi:Uncharacterized protein, putative amidase